MYLFQPPLVILSAFVGNCGFWLYCFNRVNSIGLPRPWTKRFEKLFIFLCFLIPAVVFLVERQAILEWCGGLTDMPVNTSGRTGPKGYGLFQIWAVASLGSLLALGPGWLESRRWILPPKQLRSTIAEHYNVATEIQNGVAADRLTRWLEKLPGNQISELEVTLKELELVRPVEGLDGLTIGHLSDLHFTGQLSTEFYHFVLDRFLALRPDLIVVTGDIIDYQRCLPWIKPLMGRLQAPLGCSYVLGNHDKRLNNLRELTDQLRTLGHFDLGVANQRIELASGSTIWLTGNEAPWFRRHDPSVSLDSPALTSKELRLGLSHSPDQIIWARTKQLDLLLAGHTHGGQVRLPGIGPLVSPSRFGSRYASGVFLRPPTLMHVSRGVAGTHPLRFRCPPEITLLTIRCPDTDYGHRLPKP